MEAEAQNLNQLIALFLAEAIRSRRTSLARAAEISRRVVSRLPQTTTEGQALAMLTEIEKDFQEVSSLKQALHFGHETSDIKTYEEEIRAYASRVFERDINSSNAFLQDAALPGVSIQQLCLKYPDFCDYLFSSSDKARNLTDLKIRA
jgi:hypothetical protein